MMRRKGEAVSKTDAAADAALDDVLAGLPADDTPTPNAPEPEDAPLEDAPDVDVDADDTDEAGEAGRVETSSLEGTLIGDDDTSTPPCSEEEARSLVATMRDSLITFDNTLTEVIRRRAWIPLGYETPAAFVIGEFGPTTDPDATGRHSRSHAYRLARMAMFLYGLAERVGDEALAADLPERVIRDLPARSDDAVLNRLEQALTDVPADELNSDAAKTVLNDELRQIRDEYKRTGKVSDDDWDEDNPDGENNGGGRSKGSRRRGSGDDWDDLDVDVDDDTWSADANHVGDPNRKDLTVGGSDDDDDPDAPDYSHLTADSDDADGDDDDDDDEAPARSTDVHAQDSLNATSMLDSVQIAPGQALEASEALRGILGAFKALRMLSTHLPEVLDYADDEELDDLIDDAQKADQLVQDVIAAAEDRL